MVGVGEIGEESMLARVSLLDYNGNVLYDTFVSPTEPIIDFRTQYSGVTSKLLVGAPAFKEVQEKVSNLIKGKIIVGHSLKNDFQVIYIYALMLTHNKRDIRDTCLYKPLRPHNSKSYPSLKSLATRLLDREIQSLSHCSIEDARSCLDLYKKFRARWEKDMALNMYRNKKTCK
ncbi:hypothetical protein MXB_453 [Myxobolus squamalis]|nr:hypothetical protein MXB_453 [Myxobolus squamalis]